MKHDNEEHPSVRIGREARAKEKWQWIAYGLALTIAVMLINS